MKHRKISFEKIANARDLGGLQTADGRVIASGLLLRSANLAEATEQDKTALQEKYRLAKIIDLRTQMERAEKPDVIPEGTEYLAMPVFDERVAGISHEKGAEQQSAPVMPNMEDLYRMIVTEESCRKNLGKAVRCVMEHDFTTGSVLWHCTEGKDRCGLLTVMLLSALKVERQQIFEDYLLTNEVNAPKAEGYYRQMLMMGKSEAEAEAVKNVFLAKEAYLNAAFAAIDSQYADMDAFLKKGLGIPQEALEKFREKVLEE